VNTSTQLAAGSYKLIAKSGSASVTNTPGALTVGGSGVSGTATLGVTSGELILTVAAQPTLNSATLSNSLSTTFGSASGATSFIASGSNLSGNITATAQSGFEVSTSENGTYSSSVEVASGSPVWVRVIANNSIGALDNVTAVVLTGGGAAGSVNVTTSSSGNAVTVANLPAVTFTPPASLVYNRTAKTYGASASGVVLTLNYTGRNSTSYNSATAPMNVGDYTVTATTSNTNYTGSQAQNFSITQKALTISGATATSRAYNGTTTIAVSGGSLVGVETGDTVTLGGTPTGTVTSAAVGTGKSVTVSGYALGGDSAANYSVTQPTGLTADITAKALTLAAPTITKSKVFNGNTIAAVTAGELSGVETGDTVNVSAAARYEDANAGTNKMITVTYVISGASVANYTLHNVDTIFAGVITPSTPTITSGPTATAITVGQALSASTLSGSATGVSNAVVGGNFAFATPNFVPSIGTANHGVIFTPTNANYGLLTNLTASVTVNRLPLTSVGAKFSVSTNGVYTVVDSNNAPIEGATFAYLYRGRTNGVTGLNTNYAFLSYSNTNAPSQPGFYNVTATASGNYSGTLNEDYALAGPLYRTINLTRAAGTGTNTFSRATVMSTVQHIGTNSALFTGAAGTTNGVTWNLSWTAVNSGQSTMSNGETNANTVTLRSADSLRLVPGNSNSVSDTFGLTISDGFTPIAFPVVVTTTNGAVTNVPNLTATKVSNTVTTITNWSGETPTVVTNSTRRVTFMARPNRPITILFQDPNTSAFRHVTATNVPFISPTNQPLTNGTTVTPVIFTPPTGIISLNVVTNVSFYLGRMTNGQTR
ncbi:MAG: beta strand repeat-containing protein, partial [Chthoniobacterales bacterium]